MLDYCCFIGSLIEKGNIYMINSFLTTLLYRLDKMQYSQVVGHRKKNMTYGRGIMKNIWHHSFFLLFKVVFNTPDGFENNLLSLNDANLKA